MKWLLLAAAVLALPGCGVFGGNKPVNPPAELGDFDASLRVQRLWTQDLGGNADNLRLGLRPSSDGARVYAGGRGGRAWALDVHTGERLWMTDLDAALSAGPGYGDELVVFGTSEGHVIALDAQSGEVVWDVATGSEILAPPAVSPLGVAVRTVDGRLLALSRQRGEELWSVEQSVPSLSVRGTAAPVFAGNLVVSGFDNGRVGAYDAVSGDTAWEFLLAPPTGRTDIERLVDIGAAVALAGQDAYMVSFHGRVAAAAVQTGQLLWARDASSFNGLSVDAGAVYYSNDTSHVVALSRRAGTPLWTNEDLLNRAVTTPEPFGTAVVVGDFDGYLHWLDAGTGRLAARERVDSHAIVAAPLAVGDVLVAQSEGGRLAAYQVTGSR